MDVFMPEGELADRCGWTNKPIARTDLGAMWHGRSRSAETNKPIKLNKTNQSKPIFDAHAIRVARIGILRLLRLGRVIRLLQLLRHFAERISIEKPWNPCTLHQGNWKGESSISFLRLSNISYKHVTVAVFYCTCDYMSTWDSGCDGTAASFQNLIDPNGDFFL